MASVPVEWVTPLIAGAWLNKVPGQFLSVKELSEMNLQELALIQFEVYDSDSHRLMGLATVDLPEIELKTTDISGAGIAGEVSWPVRGNFGNFSATFHFRTLTAAACEFFNQDRGHSMSLREATDRYDSGSGERKVGAIRMDIRAHAVKLTAGKLEPGETMDTELEMMIDALSVKFEGTEKLKVDKFNYSYEVGGSDMFGAVKAALGR